MRIHLLLLVLLLSCNPDNVQESLELTKDSSNETRKNSFSVDLDKCLNENVGLWALIDKVHSLSNEYVPGDLVVLKPGAYLLNVQGIKLRKVAAESLAEMASAAKADGITLTIGSAYRSYDYQAQVHTRIVKQRGQTVADRISAKPGHSQHQTGLAVDFSPMEDSFATTAAGKWVANNAARFGWSLSYPQGYEDLTGYQWESWHYRYVGETLALFIEKYFDGIQQKALEFIHEHEANLPR